MKEIIFTGSVYVSILSNKLNRKRYENNKDMHFSISLKRTLQEFLSSRLNFPFAKLVCSSLTTR